MEGRQRAPGFQHPDSCSQWGRAREGCSGAGPGLADPSDRPAAPPTSGSRASKQTGGEQQSSADVVSVALLWLCLLPSGGEGGTGRRKPQHLPVTGDVQRSPRSHLPHCCNQIPGHSRMQSPPPSRGGWGRAQESACLLLPNPQPVGRACLAVLGKPQGLGPQPSRLCRGPLLVLLAPGS